MLGLADLRVGDGVPDGEAGVAGTCRSECVMPLSNSAVVARKSARSIRQVNSRSRSERLAGSEDAIALPLSPAPLHADNTLIRRILGTLQAASCSYARLSPVVPTGSLQRQILPLLLPPDIEHPGPVADCGNTTAPSIAASPTGVGC